MLNGAHIKKEPHNLMREFQDYLRCKQDGSQNFLGWLKDLKNTDSFVIWDRKDIKPFFVYIICMLQKILRKKI